MVKEYKQAIFKISLNYLALLVVFSFTPIAGATVYQPGETLEPDCAPGSANCGVAIFNLNGQDTSAQTLIIGNSGLDFNIVSETGIHTFNLPDASTSARGLLTAGDWNIFNNKQNALGFTPLNLANNLSDLASPESARTNLGLGSIAELSSINNGNWSGTALAVANGGTGSTDGSIAGTGALSLISDSINVLTLDSGTTGAINVGAGAFSKIITIGNITDTTALNLKSGTGNIILEAGGTGTTSKVQIGSPTGKATPDLFVLDAGSSEPIGINGGMYYSTVTNKFRCYQNSAWTDCIGGDTQLIGKISDQSLISNTTLTSDSDLKFPVESGETWIFHFFLYVTNANSAGPDFKAAILGESGWTCNVQMSGDEAVGGPFPQRATTDCDNAPTELPNGSIASDAGNGFNVRIQGYITTNSAGFVTLQFSQKISSVSAITIKKGSYVQAFKVGGAEMAEAMFVNNFDFSDEESGREVLFEDIFPQISDDKTDNEQADQITIIQSETSRNPIDMVKQKIASGQKFVSDFVSARVTAIRGYFDELFAKKIYTSQLCFTKADGSEVCLDGDQLDSLLQNVSNTSIIISPDPILPISSPILNSLDNIEISTPNESIPLTNELSPVETEIPEVELPLTSPVETDMSEVDLPQDEPVETGIPEVELPEVGPVETDT